MIRREHQESLATRRTINSVSLGSSYDRDTAMDVGSIERNEHSKYEIRVRRFEAEKAGNQISCLRTMTKMQRRALFQGFRWQKTKINPRTPTMRTGQSGADSKDETRRSFRWWNHQILLDLVCVLVLLLVSLQSSVHAYAARVEPSQRISSSIQRTD